MASRIRRAGESRGFSETRLLTHWPEIAGEAVAAMCRPVQITYGRGGLGATLTVLSTGAQAPLLQMQLPAIRERVNATYGYAAISRIRITQTAPQGFAEPATTFAGAPAKPAELSQTETARVAESVAQVEDQSLKAALDRLGRNVLMKAKS